jgi:hypothetical protein
MPGYLSKLLFPSASRSQRRRKLRAIFVSLLIGALIIAVVAGLLYLVYAQARR